MVTWFNLSYPQHRGLLFHIPNGRMRSRREGALLKREGVVPGVADLALMIPRREYRQLEVIDVIPGLFIEVKQPGSYQVKTQKIWQAQVESQGYRYEVVRSLQEFIDLIEQYLQK